MVRLNAPYGAYLNGYWKMLHAIRLPLLQELKLHR